MLPRLPKVVKLPRGYKRLLRLFKLPRGYERLLKLPKLPRGARVLKDYQRVFKVA